MDFGSHRAWLARDILVEMMIELPIVPKALMWLKSLLSSSRSDQAGDANVSVGDVHAPTVIQHITNYNNFFGPLDEESMVRLRELMPDWTDSHEALPGPANDS